MKKVLGIRIKLILESLPRFYEVSFKSGKILCMKEDLEDINCHQYTRAAEEDKKELTVKNFFKFGQGGFRVTIRYPNFSKL